MVQQTTPPQDPGASVFVRAGTAVGAGAIAALACVVPAALRVAGATSDGPGFGQAWAGLTAAALAPMVASVVVLRGARDGLRAFAGPGASLRAFGAGLWLATTLVALSILGTVLRATTHHHALAGVTYAFGGLVIAGGSAIVCVRVVSIARGLPERGRRVLLPALAIAVSIMLFAVGVRFVRSASRDAASYAAASTVIDVLAFVLAAVFASRRALASRRWLAVSGLPLAVVLLVAGVLALQSKPTVDVMTQCAPAFAPFADVLAGR